MDKRGNPKFTEKEIKIIKTMIDAGIKTSRIIKEFETANRKVNRMDISNIRTGKHYKDVINDFNIYNKPRGK